MSIFATPPIPDLADALDHAVLVQSTSPDLYDSGIDQELAEPTQAPLRDPLVLDPSPPFDPRIAELLLAALRSCAGPNVRYDVPTFDMSDPNALDALSCPGTYIVPQSHIMHGEDDDVVCAGLGMMQVAILPIPTTPYGMGLSFDKPGWRAPAWRTPDDKKVEDGCIDPALLIAKAESTPDPTVGEHDHAAVADPILQHVTACSKDVSSSGEDEDDSMDSDFKGDPKASASRPVRPLPRKHLVPKSTRAPPSRRAPVSVSSPSTSSSSSSLSSSSASTSKKRKARGPAGQHATKKAAISPTRVPFRSTVAPVPSHLRDAPPPGSDRVPESYWYLLDKGCTPFGTGMRCNIEGCPHTTDCFPDMARHIITHFPELRESCPGCPAILARTDSLNRHYISSSQCKKPSDARKAFLASYKNRPDVLKMQLECSNTPQEKGKLNKELNRMFAEDFAASKKAGRSA
ncbi:hypothetical protein B0H11DRAFT_440660 [Mycena galericulata]|nr:hypothetical protein B0H11DRAFT_440660 [Mycena galericulata]